MKRRNNLDIILGVAAIAIILVVAGMLLGRQSMKQNAGETETAVLEERPVVEPVGTAQGASPDGEAASPGTAAALPDGEATSPGTAAASSDGEAASPGTAAASPDSAASGKASPVPETAAAPETAAGTGSGQTRDADMTEQQAVQDKTADSEAAQSPQQEQRTVKAAAVTKKTAKKTKEQRDQQMAELYDYWSRQDREAVGDVIRLPRNVELSAELEGSDTFYYYGDTTAQGVPNGTGLAVYADNQFYFGGWLNGVRSGEGEWIKVYRYDDRTEEKDKLYLEHTYLGEWAGDLPNGEGQEHFDLEASLIRDNDGCVQNVIGRFRDGLYDGEMYIIRLYQDGSVKEWEGTANYGVWNPLGKKNKKGEYPINIRKVDEDNYIWCRPADNVDFGVDGMIAAK